MTELATTLKVLIVEDEPEDADEMLIELERAGLEIEASETIADLNGLVTALTRSWDVIICDYVLPGIDWRDIFLAVRTTLDDVPFIVVSGKRGEEFAVEVMRMGAQDYITKRKLFRLGPAIEREVVAHRRRKENIASQMQYALELQKSKRFEASGKLATGLAHNMNNALTAIMGCIDLALKSEDLQRIHDILEKAIRACEHAGSMVQQLNSLNADTVCELKPTELTALANQLEGLVRATTSEQIDVSFDFPGNLPTVMSDASAIEQILLNLVLNACDAMEGAGQIKIEFTSDNLRWGFTVEDNGRGIPVELQGRIFEPFFTTKPGVGTGVGLASVAQLVQALDGELILESTSGIGTTFKITFPVELE